MSLLLWSFTHEVTVVFILCVDQRNWLCSRLFIGVVILYQGSRFWLSQLLQDIEVYRCEKSFQFLVCHCTSYRALSISIPFTFSTRSCPLFHVLHILPTSLCLQVLCAKWVKPPCIYKGKTPWSGKQKGNMRAKGKEEEEGEVEWWYDRHLIRLRFCHISLWLIMNESWILFFGIL